MLTCHEMDIQQKASVRGLFRFIGRLTATGDPPKQQVDLDQIFNYIQVDCNGN